MYQLCMAVLGPPWWPWHVRVRMWVYACVCVCVHSNVCLCSTSPYQATLVHWTKKVIVEEGHSINQLVHILWVTACTHRTAYVRTYTHMYVNSVFTYVLWLIDTIACEPPCTNLQWCHCIHTYIPIRTYMLLIIKCTLMFHLGKDMYLHTWYVVKRTLLVRKWPVLSVPPVHLQSVHICFSADTPRRLRF